MVMNRALVLGASGWLGHRLWDALGDDCERLGIYHHHEPVFSGETIRTANKDHDGILRHVIRYAPTHLFNLARGESEADFDLHRRLIDLCSQEAIHYSYASSFNACDADVSTSHKESDLPNATTAYGQFKARCELALMEGSVAHAIFRFPMVHGWAPHRETRTVAFLRRLSANEPVQVPVGLVQNRIADTQLARMMVSIARHSGQGVFHLGAVDHSDEVDFLRSLALAFGYPTSLVQPGDDEPCNAVMIPQKVFDLGGDSLRCTEQDAIAALVNDPQLQRYRRA